MSLTEQTDESAIDIERLRGLARKASAALRHPDRAFGAVANTVRQSVADIIDDQSIVINRLKSEQAGWARAAVSNIERAVNLETDGILSWLRGELDKANQQQPDNIQDSALVGERIYVLTTAIAAIEARKTA